MRLAVGVPGWAVPLLGAVLLTTACATRAPHSGGGSPHGERALLRSPLVPPSMAPRETGGPERLRRRRGAWGLESNARAGPGEAAVHGVASGGTLPQGPATCGGQVVPRDWPDFSSGGEVLLAPFLTCTSPAEYVALQQRVDMPRLVEALDEWSAVRLGALGPVREDAAALLQRKRAAFLVSATERYGPYHAEVFALFVLHSAHDDEVDAVLRLLARDKQLGQTLALMPAVRQELEARGLPLSRYPERAERGGDVLRGLGRAARDALATSPLVDGGRYLEMTGRWAHLPPPYQHAAREVERALALRHFSAGSVALGTFDAMTFGVPLGFYYLVAGTGQGAYSLSQGEYEQATRELAPALLLGTLYAGGKGVRALSQARGAGTPALGGLQAMQQHLRGLQELGRQVQTKLGVDGVRELVRWIRERREVGHFVAVGGVDAALALHEARGNVARAQAVMSRARPGATGAPVAGGGAHKGAGQVAPVVDDGARASLEAGAAERAGGLASLVDEGAGLTREVVEARLALMEMEAPGPRLPRDVAVLEKQRPSAEAAPPGAEGNPRWGEYVAYYEGRLRELEQGKAVKAPMRWDAYAQMRGWFARGLAFERLMVGLLEADARLPRAERRFLGAFVRPRISRSVGVWKPESGLRYVDVLVIEEGGSASGPPRVETFSFKSRDLSSLKGRALLAQMVEDASEALQKYGGTLDIRRGSLHSLLPQGSEVPVRRVRLVYEGGTKVDNLDAVVTAVEGKVQGVEVLFQ
ncbi:hypothetical protein Q664_14010 [Archangium violaceum Cb vi76]|uniref:Lipoprotein n=1 Tax=Archangium violaceum Cb vi76 TaxID=1406225 RepID=A0A084SW71_9BACT|nr:hypothetical protein Q664_14010 [Archangium violaceum Cb vi76]